MLLIHNILSVILFYQRIIRSSTYWVNGLPAHKFDISSQPVRSLLLYDVLNFSLFVSNPINGFIGWVNFSLLVWLS